MVTARIGCNSAGPGGTPPARGAATGIGAMAWHSVIVRTVLPSFHCKYMQHLVLYTVCS